MTQFPNCPHGTQYAGYHCDCWVCAQQESHRRSREFRSKLTCWIKGHIWKYMGVTMSHPSNRMHECSRCGTKKSIKDLYG